MKLKVNLGIKTIKWLKKQKKNLKKIVMLKYNMSNTIFIIHISFIFNSFKTQFTNLKKMSVK